VVVVLVVVVVVVMIYVPGKIVISSQILSYVHGSSGGVQIHGGEVSSISIQPVAVHR